MKAGGQHDQKKQKQRGNGLRISTGVVLLWKLQFKRENHSYVSRRWNDLGESGSRRKWTITAPLEKATEERQGKSSNWKGKHCKRSPNPILKKLSWKHKSIHRRNICYQAQTKVCVFWKRPGGSRNLAVLFIGVCDLVCSLYKLTEE